MYTLKQVLQWNNYTLQSHCTFTGVLCHPAFSHLVCFPTKNYIIKHRQLYQNFKKGTFCQGLFHLIQAWCHSISFPFSFHCILIQLLFILFIRKRFFLFARLCSDRVARNALVFMLLSCQERSSFQLSGLIVDLKLLCVLGPCFILDISNKYDILLLLQFREAIISQETPASCVNDNNKFSSELCMEERGKSILSYLLAFISRAVV